MGDYPRRGAFSLALVAELSQTMASQDAGWILFLGLSATFGLVYLLPRNGGRMTWALYPAAALLAMAVLVLAAMAQVGNVLWPAALILVGVYLMYRRLRPSHV